MSSATPPVRGEIVPTHAQHDQVVEIHWRLKDGRIYTDRRTCPPQAVIETGPKRRKGDRRHYTRRSEANTPRAEGAPERRIHKERRR
jgi:hypothetical protein